MQHYKTSENAAEEEPRRRCGLVARQSSKKKKAHQLRKSRISNKS